MTEKRVNSKTCYACDQPATTREHAPPQSFFPEGHRHNLITVPSCALHNNDNSKDVEYARNIICVSFGVNSVAEQHFLDKALRSLDRSPALLQKSFGDIRPVIVQGLQVGAFTTDPNRLSKVLSACLTALHFLETGEKIPRWEIVFTNFGFSGGDTTPEQVEAWNQALSIFKLIPFHVRQTSSPDVFQYAVSDIEGGRVYSMRFYKAFLIFGFRPADTST